MNQTVLFISIQKVPTSLFKNHFSSMNVDIALISHFLMCASGNFKIHCFISEEICWGHWQAPQPITSAVLAAACSSQISIMWQNRSRDGCKKGWNQTHLDMYWYFNKLLHVSLQSMGTTTRKKQHLSVKHRIKNNMFSPGLLAPLIRAVRKLLFYVLLILCTAGCCRRCRWFQIKSPNG